MSQTVALQRVSERRDTARPVGPPAFGALSTLAKDNIYWFGTEGFIFTSPWVCTPSTARQSGVLLLTASGAPFELAVGGRVLRRDALGIAPLVRRGLRAVDVGLVSVNAQPHHPCFAAFSQIGRSGLLELERERFRRFDADLVRAYEGRLAHREARCLFDALLETAAREIRPPLRRDERADLLLSLVRENPDCSLRFLARKLHLSYTTTSHLFSRSIGLPFRTYQHWIKCMRASEGFGGELNLTDIAQRAGFADLAHLSRAWQRRFGVTPSYLRDREHVRVIHPE